LAGEDPVERGFQLIQPYLRDPEPAVEPRRT
jgi:hypothetical protein